MWLRISLGIALLGICLSGCQPEGRIRVACVGDSITEGAGIPDPAHNAYPAQLGEMLGEGYTVRNFGVGGRTLLRKGDYPYVNEAAFSEALAFDPDIVILKLGTNDAKPQNWQYQSDFVSDYLALIDTFARASDSGVRILVCLPVPAYSTQFDIVDSVVNNALLTRVRTVAQQAGGELVDLHTALSGHPEWFPDGIHPNRAGATRMAEVLHQAIQGQQP